MWRPKILDQLNRPFIIYLFSFAIVWVALRQLEAVRFGLIWSTFAVAALSFVTYLVLRKGQGLAAPAWKSALVSLVAAEIFFALTFWSSPTHSKALVLTAAVFFIERWFDKMELKWLIVFLAILTLALTLTPFQIL